MPGRHLDSRSYTILLLIVAASLLTINLFAQISERRGYDRNVIGDRPIVTDQQDNLSEAASVAEVAAATREVAASNREIANAINRLASAVGGLELSIPAGQMMAPASGGMTQSTGGVLLQDGQDGPEQQPVDIAPSEQVPYEGTIEIN